MSASKTQSRHAGAAVSALLVILWIFAAVYHPLRYSVTGNTYSDIMSPSPVHDAQLSGPVETRPLVLYAYKESDTARKNLEFFAKQGLHDRADFVFIFQGKSQDSALIPERDNIRIVLRENTCFDLGAYREVLQGDDLYRRYKRFIMLNASIRGPFVPFWSRNCWSDVYTSRVNDRTKLVGMTANCWPRFHVQSMIWATDDVGIGLLLDPPGSSSKKDQFGGENDTVGLGGCYDGWTKAVHAEVGATSLFLDRGYDVDLMMAAFHGSRNYVDECDSSQNGDMLRNGHYFGSNIHPYETLFIKANRDIDPNLINHLTEWHLASGTNSWDACRAADLRPVG